MHKMSRRPTTAKTGLFIVLSIASVCAFLYSILGVLQTISLGVGPDYSKSRLLTNLGVWGALALLSLGFAIYLGLRLRGGRGRIDYDKGGG